jgi:hypothetical protein
VTGLSYTSKVSSPAGPAPRTIGAPVSIDSQTKPRRPAQSKRYRSRELRKLSRVPPGAMPRRPPARKSAGALSRVPFTKPSCAASRPTAPTRKNARSASARGSRPIAPKQWAPSSSESYVARLWFDTSGIAPSRGSRSRPTTSYRWHRPSRWTAA